MEAIQTPYLLVLRLKKKKFSTLIDKECHSIKENVVSIYITQKPSPSQALWGQNKRTTIPALQELTSDGRERAPLKEVKARGGKRLS